MLLAIFLLFLIAASGYVITYFYDRETSFLARLCAGIVIGQVLFSLFGFALGCLLGMSANVAILGALMTALPLAFLIQKTIKTSAQKDVSIFFSSIKTFFFRPTLASAATAAIYFLLIVFLWLFFERAMLNTDGGISTGSPHNVGDISFHLQAIYGFLDGQNFPPQNPSFAGAKFTYPFMADLVTAMLATVGAKISAAMFWQNMFLTVALIGLMHCFTLRLTDNKFAAKLAPLILLFSGGLGFLLFFNDALNSEAGVLGLLMKMPDNYTIRPQSEWRWGNTLTVLFMTQRSILLGLPLALIVLIKIWKIFANFKFQIPNSKLGENPENERTTNIFHSPFSIFRYDVIVVGLLAGTLPLVHAHSFAVVMGMTACLALMNWRRWREWATFFLAAAVISVPELLWAMTGSAAKAGNFVDWEFGWDNHDTNIIYFWLTNTGLFIPLLLAAIVFLIVQQSEERGRRDERRVDKTYEETELNHGKNPLSLIPPPSSLLLFWLPFALCFIVPNVVRLAPWVWDNIKVLIYWFVVSIPLVALLLAKIWERGAAGKVLTLVLLVGLTLSGWLDVWRVASKQMEYQVFNPLEVEFARQVRQKLPPNAIVISLPEYHSPAALMGRRWFLGSVSHVWSHGIDPAPRENQLRNIYFGDATAEKLLRENKIDYIILSPEEREDFVVNELFLSRFPVVIQEGEYRLLQVK